MKPLLSFTLLTFICGHSIDRSSIYLADSRVADGLGESAGKIYCFVELYIRLVEPSYSFMPFTDTVVWEY